MIRRPCFLFTARSPQLAPRASCEDTERLTAGAHECFLLIPDVASLDYFLFSVSTPIPTENLVRDPTAVGALLELVQEHGAMPAGAKGAWGSSDGYSFIDRIRDGAFFAVHERQKVALRVLDGCPIVYADATGQPRWLTPARNTIRLETPYAISAKTYRLVRQLIVRLPIEPADFVLVRRNRPTPSGSSRPVRRRRPHGAIPDPGSRSPRPDMRLPANPRPRGPDGAEDHHVGGAGAAVPRPPRGPRPGSFNGGLPPWAPHNPTAPRWQAGRPMSRRVPPPPRPAGFLSLQRASCPAYGCDRGSERLACRGGAL